MQSLPARNETIEAIRKLDLLVVCDILPTEITEWADIVLPEDLYLERFDDLLSIPSKEPTIGLRQPIVKSPYDTRPAWRIAKDLAKEMGVLEYFGYTTFEEYLETRLAGTGVTLSELKSRGAYKTPRTTKLYLEPGENYTFHTPSGKVELYSSRLKEAGFDPLPVYRPPFSPNGHGLRLLYGRSPLHSFGRTQNNPTLADLEPSNSIWVHPKTAKAFNVQNDKPVMIQNTPGDETGPLLAYVTERVPEDAVYMVHGFGHRTSHLRRAFGRGGDDNALMNLYAVDPISGCTGMRVTFVTLRPI
jgi:thiosulfate reductase/polysulfide reductase chain A